MKTGIDYREFFKDDYVGRNIFPGYVPTDILCYVLGAFDVFQSNLLKKLIRKCVGVTLSAKFILLSLTGITVHIGFTSD